MFTVTQVKIPNYVPEWGQQNRGHKQHPNIHKGPVTRMVLSLAALEADLGSSLYKLLIPKHIQQLGNSLRYFLISHTSAMKQKSYISLLISEVLFIQNSKVEEWYRCTTSIYNPLQSNPDVVSAK